MSRVSSHFLRSDVDVVSPTTPDKAAANVVHINTMSTTATASVLPEGPVAEAEPTVTPVMLLQIFRKPI